MAVVIDVVFLVMVNSMPQMSNISSKSIIIESQTVDPIEKIDIITEQENDVLSITPPSASNEGECF